MTKKSRIGGIDAIFQNTEENKQVQEKLSRVNFDIPVSLKQQLQIYCIQKKISLKDFFTDVINEHLKTF